MWRRKCRRAPGVFVPKKLWAFAAKRLYRTAQGFNPGSGVAEIRPESGGRSASLGSSRIIPSTRPTSSATFHANRSRTRTTTSTRTSFFGRRRPKSSTAPTPLLEVGAAQLHRRNRRARSLIHARRRFRRWVYFGFFGELLFGSVGKLFGRKGQLRSGTKAISQMRGDKEELILGRQVAGSRPSPRDDNASLVP